MGSLKIIMPLKDITLPSNKKFGLFFCVIFSFFSFFFYYKGIEKIAYIFLIISIIFLTISYLSPHLLHPLNRAWMSLGYFIGFIINPIILGLIYFLIITPYGLIIKLIGRDELKIKISDKKSYWIYRKCNRFNENFNKQY